MISKNFKVAAFSLFAAVGCDPYQSKPAAVSETTSTVTLEDVKRDAAKSQRTRPPRILNKTRTNFSWT